MSLPVWHPCSEESIIRKVWIKKRSMASCLCIYLFNISSSHWERDVERGRPNAQIVQCSCKLTSDNYSWCQTYWINVQMVCYEEGKWDTFCQEDAEMWHQCLLECGKVSWTFPLASVQSSDKSSYFLRKLCEQCIKEAVTIRGWTLLMTRKWALGFLIYLSFSSA